jgi:hypothetical protein
LAGIQGNTALVKKVQKVQKINKNNSYNKKEWNEGWGSGRKLPFLKYARKQKKVKNQFGIRKRKE